MSGTAGTRVLCVNASPDISTIEKHPRSTMPNFIRILLVILVIANQTVTEDRTAPTLFEGTGCPARLTPHVTNFYISQHKHNPPHGLAKISTYVLVIEAAQLNN